MNFFRAHGRAARGAGAVGIVFALSSLMAGCALYDAFQNPAEGENNGDNCDGSSLMLDAAPDACFQECDVSEDVPGLTQYQSNLAECAEGNSCYAVVESTTMSEQGYGVCVSRQAGDDCAVRDLTEYLPDLASYQPCEAPDAEYHVAARPGGGFVVAGCAIQGGEAGYRLTWFDSDGTVDSSTSQSKHYASGDGIRNGRLRDLMVAGTTSSDHEVAFGAFERGDSSSIEYWSGVFPQTLDSIESLVSVESETDTCATGVLDQVALAGGGSNFVFASCASGGGISLTPLIVDSANTVAAGNRITWRPQGTADIVLSDITLRSDVDTLAFDAADVRVTGRSGPGSSAPMMLYSTEALMTESSAGANVEVRNESPFDLSEYSVERPSPTGVPPEPSIRTVMTQNASFFAGNSGAPSRPRLFSRNLNSTSNADVKIGDSDDPNEVVIELVYSGGTQPNMLLAQPQADLPRSGEVAMILLTRVSPTANPADTYGRLYGLTTEFVVGWTREVGLDGGFVPQDLAVSADRRIAVVGRSAAGDLTPRLVFTDLLGRPFCDAARLGEMLSEEDDMQ